MLVLSPKEYINRGCPETVWFYMPDLVSHLFSSDMKNSLHKGNGNISQMEEHKKDLKEEMKKGTHDAEDLNVQAECFERKRTHRELDSDSGTFDVERYLDGDERPFMDVFTQEVNKTSKTILIEMGASWGERHNEETFRKRHQAAYAEVLKAEATGTPIRVVGCYSASYHEFKVPRKYYAIVKDYTDPIFPEIWGCLRSGTTANDMANLISFTVIGTKSGSNGSPVSFDVDVDFPEDEDLILIDPKRARSNRAKIISIN
jgi:hypothetical protein